uniref:Fungal lipase-type domain-containing protein n=1 Tax=viral metagenome TaxID=1070528 RepID=A0A6C0CH07_9ZZZZ
MDTGEKTCPKAGVKPSVAAIITIVAVTIAVLIVIYIVYRLYYGFIDKTIAKLTKDVQQSCIEFGPARYRYTLTPPVTNGVYEHEVATALWDIGTAVSLSNCTDMVGIPSPFHQVHKIVSPIDGQMYAYIFSNANMACIGFSGTYSKSQWYADLNIKQVTPTVLLNSLSNHATWSGDPIKVHEGYYKIYSSIQDEIHKWWQENRGGKTNLFITGHSLGGAVSTLCAFDFAAMFRRLGDTTVITHYSMSSPRVGNLAFSRTFDRLSPFSIRVYNTEDIVPSLPPAVWDGLVYQHICAKRGTVAFTKTMSSLAENHIDAYYHLP